MPLCSNIDHILNFDKYTECIRVFKAKLYMIKLSFQRAQDQLNQVRNKSYECFTKIVHKPTLSAKMGIVGVLALVGGDRKCCKDEICLRKQEESTG